MPDRKSLKSMALEVFSIVFAVLLALGVSEWAQEREKAELATTALANIVREIEANQQLLSGIHENNSATIATAEAALENEDLEESEDLQFIPGLQVRSTAWEVLLATGVSNHLDYQLLLDLSQLYSVQLIYQKTGMQLAESAMSMAAMATVNNTEIDNQHFQEQFSAYFHMMLQMEEALLQAYQKNLEKLKSTTADIP